MRRRRFEVRVARNIDKADSKIFQFNFASSPFIVAGKLFCTRILFEQHLVLQLRELFFSLLFRRCRLF